MSIAEHNSEIADTRTIKLGEVRRARQRIHEQCREWFGEHYDIAALDVSMAVRAVQEITGDPLWMMIVGAPSTAKTETVVLTLGCKQVYPVSTITSDAALLSGTSDHDKMVGATGGILREIGSAGTIVIKDFTSILSMHHSKRGPLLSALREVYDGRWDRPTGGGGGEVLKWQGRVCLLAAVTNAWDKHHGAISEMGDRFVLLRITSSNTDARLEAARQALKTLDSAPTKRQQLSKAVAWLMARVDPINTPDLTLDELERIVQAAELAAHIRSTVDTDFKGDVVQAHEPEGSARLTKQLAQLFRGVCLIGGTRERALELALRCARDSVPPLRLRILEYMEANANQTTYQIAKGLQEPRTSTDRHIQALIALGLVEYSEVVRPKEDGSDAKTVWHYSVAPHIKLSVLTDGKERPNGLYAIS